MGAVLGMDNFQSINGHFVVDNVDKLGLLDHDGPEGDSHEV